MTPLANYYAKQLTLGKKDRAPIENRSMGRLISDLVYDVHCFEITKIFDLVDELEHSLVIEAKSRGDVVSVRDLWFLPAPKTWIEWIARPGDRCAVLLEELPSTARNASAPGRRIVCTIVTGQVYAYLGMIDAEKFLHMNTQGSAIAGYEQADFDTAKLGAQVYAILALINSPRIIGRRQMMPNRGLEKRLSHTFGAGRFPLRAWTEIELNVAKPIEIDDGQPHEAHLTGRRALHFCRAHIRIRRGKLEYVTSHWRGDPAIGIKQTRYKVVA